MTIHDRDKIIAAAKEAGTYIDDDIDGNPTIEVIPESCWEKFYITTFEAGRQAEREEINQDAERYRWLRTHALQRAWVSLGTDFDGENFVDLRCEFKVPEPPNLPYEDDEGLEWSDKDFDSAIDTAIRARGDMK